MTAGHTCQEGPSASVVDVETWLYELGLQRYAAAFEAHHVDAQTLRSLNEADLVDMGVKSVGHRRKLSEAIARLRAAANLTSRSMPVARSPAPLAAERRQLTVVYCDMVESTTLSQRLDAEDYRTLIQRFHQACLRQVALYDGWVANFIGDCVLVYFGWPCAHEDDAERAVRCGLSMVQAVRELDVPGGAALSVRVGMATGSVVVGDLIREGPAQEQSAVGVTPNLAARLQALAAPGQVVLDATTAALLCASFEVQRLGEHALKGVPEPVAVYAVIAERPADSRFDSRSGPQLAPMIGRGEELALLRQRWVQAQDGDGQALLLVGEAGIGKSRLIRAMLDACASDSHERVRWQCSPHHIGSALWPVIQYLVRCRKANGHNPNGAALDRLEALTRADHEAMALYASLLGVNGTQRFGSLEMSPRMLRERTLDVLTEQLLELAEQRPLLLVLEDAHWVDSTTLELIDRCLERIHTTRLLIVISTRPDNPPALAAHSSVTKLSLSRLNRANVQALIDRVGGDRLRPHTSSSIATRADGVPLFVEELAKAALETGEATIPASLHGTLIARLDRFPEAREVAQTAACIGREFDVSLLQMAAEQPEAVAPALDKLLAAELIYRCCGSATFAFKHALVQQAACESLLRARRQRLHARILKVLQVNRPGTSAEVLAHHAAAAGLCASASDHSQRAGEGPLRKPPPKSTRHTGDAVRPDEQQRCLSQF